MTNPNDCCQGILGNCPSHASADRRTLNRWWWWWWWWIVFLFNTMWIICDLNFRPLSAISSPGTNLLTRLFYHIYIYVYKYIYYISLLVLAHQVNIYIYVYIYIYITAGVRLSGKHCHTLNFIQMNVIIEIGLAVHWTLCHLNRVL